MKSASYQSYLNAQFDFDALERGRWAASGCDKLDFPGYGLRCSIRFSEWDSQALGARIWKVEQVLCDAFPSKNGWARILEGVADTVAAKGGECVFMRLGDQAGLGTAVAENSGWIPVDRLNIYVRETRVPESAPETGALRISDISPDEAGGFFDRVSDLFKAARIYHDPRIPVDKADGFYRRLFSAVARRQGSFAVGLFDGNVLAGLAIGERDDELSHYLSLGYVWEIGLDPAYRGKGFGRPLLEGLCGRLAGSVLMVEAGTQTDNTAANRMYLGAGFSRVAGAVTFHKWI